MAGSTDRFVLGTAAVLVILTSQLASLSALSDETAKDVAKATEGEMECEYKGPKGSNIIRTFQASNCNDCRSTNFEKSKREERLDKPFQEKFVPTRLDASKSGGQDICGCMVEENGGFVTKVVIQVRKGKCNAAGAQEACWNVYQSLMGFSQANPWTHDIGMPGPRVNGCLPCVKSSDCSRIEMPENANADLVGRLQKLALTDDDAAKRLANAQRWGVLKEEYVWMPEAEWSTCSQPCKADEASLGTRTRASQCVLQSDVSRTFASAVCQAHLGAEPAPVTEECNMRYCKKYEFTATDTWGKCSTSCGPGMQSRVFDCKERQEDGKWIKAEFKLCTAEDAPTSDEDEREKSCNLTPCSAWAVHCQNIDGTPLKDEDCAGSKPSLPPAA